MIYGDEVANEQLGFELKGSYNWEVQVIDYHPVDEEDLPR